MSDTEFVAPYIAFGTFRNFLLGLNPERIPARIDRSLMVGMAGGTQTYLLQALRQFDLIDEEGRASRMLVELARGEQAFKDGLAQIIRSRYAEQMALSDRQGTAAQLAESFAFTGYQGSTRRKAITFFLNAAAAAELPLSQHFRSPAAGRSSTAVRRKQRAKVPASQPEARPAPLSAGEQRTVQLASGGTLTISCTTQFLDLSREDRSFVFGLVDELDDYARETHLERASAPVVDGSETAE